MNSFSNHNYLESYCKNFNLRIDNKKILDCNMKVIGRFDSIEDKYVFFEKAGLMKKSDLFLAILENSVVH